MFNCRPGTPFDFQFSNPIDADKFDDAMVKVEPAIPGLSVQVWNDHVSLRGETRGGTSYKVTFAGTLPDQFGQTLGKEETRELTVLSAEPALSGNGYGIVLADPATAPGYSVSSINHPKLHVRTHRVSVEDWPAFVTYMEAVRQSAAAPPGKQVFDGDIKAAGVRDEMAETRIDLEKVTGAHGHAVVYVEPTQATAYRQYATAWVQATEIGLSAFVDGSDLYAWATSLKDGKPLADVEVEIRPGGAHGKTGKDGLAKMALSGEFGRLLIARRGDDVALLPESTYFWSGYSGGWKKVERAANLTWYIANDRGMYKPGEVVKFKGWLRQVGQEQFGDVAMVAPGTRLHWVAREPRGNEIGKGDAAVNASGGFDGSFSLPDNANLGWARVEFSRVGAAPGEAPHIHTFQIQEFRRPEFEVTLSPAQGPYLVGTKTTVGATAAYYAGGGLANAPIEWRVMSTPGSYTPPNRSDFTFGRWVPWWSRWHESYEYGDYEYQRSSGAKQQVHSARTDGAGKHTLGVEILEARPTQPMNLTVYATVQDVNRQAWSANRTLLVHPASLYIGIRPKRQFVRQGEKLQVDAIVVDIDGKAVSGQKAVIEAQRIEWKWRGNRSEEKIASTESCAVASGEKEVPCTFSPEIAGSYRLVATVTDDKGRQSRTERSVWVVGKISPHVRNVAQEEVNLIPDRDKDAYRVGDTAEILVLAPFAPAEGLLTLRRNGVVSTEHFSMAEASKVITVKLDERLTPNVWVQVDLVGSAPRADDHGEVVLGKPNRPAYARGSINLPVPPSARKLGVDVKPRAAALAPGGKTVVDVSVKSPTGAPVANAEIALVVVDEAILSLSNYRLPDPIAVFYFERGPGVRDHHARAFVQLARSEEVSDLQRTRGDGPSGGNKKGRMGGEGLMPASPAPAKMDSRAGKSEAKPADAMYAMALREEKEEEKDETRSQQQTPIQLRRDFRGLALFAASVPTDARGHAEVPVSLPDNLTRYRVMAVVAAKEAWFGKGEATITARLPLMVRPSPPRFLNFGDSFELPVVVQNQTDEQITADVAVRSSNAKFEGSRGRRVVVPANQRVEVRFPTSTLRAGEAKFQVGGAAAGAADASEFTVKVWTPATSEAFASYGVIDNGAVAQPVRAPKGVFTEFGGLEVTTSSTALHSLADAVLYLVQYPYECSEQISSRVLGIVALKDVLAAFGASELPPPAVLTKQVDKDLSELARMQNSDGGFGFWAGDGRSWPFLTVHVAHAAQRAREKGFVVPEQMIARLLPYLQTIETRYPPEYGEDIRRTITSYALYVRKRLGDRDGKRARGLIQEWGGVTKTPFEPLGWLLSVLSGDSSSTEVVAEIRRHLGNRVTETAGSAHFATEYSDGAHLILSSNRRADGILLEALIEDQPNSDIIPKLVDGLLANRKAGRWYNTQENAFILLALDRYFRTYEKVTPQFVAEAWLGKDYAGEHAFKGYNADRHHIDIPMSYLASKGDSTLTLAKRGAGRLYYRVGMRYAPTELKLAPMEEGFTVERSYEAVDDPGDVRHENDGTWVVKAGAEVRVKLTMVAPARRYHVALVDPLPAGLEPLNPALAVTGPVKTEGTEVIEIGGPSYGDPWRGGHWWWRERTWYEHQNMRDERVEAFSSLVWGGVYSYVYTARATTPGRFVTPPTRAEEMYSPETFGRGATDYVVVK
jgi:uncharacterized protein YfaS (alpha-2-macroglobulin family)